MSELQHSDNQLINLDPHELQNGLARLVFIVVELLRDLMEKQAYRRIQAGTIQQSQINDLGLAFKRIKSKLTELYDTFEIEEDEVKLPLSKLGLTNDTTDLATLLDQLIDTGVVAAGDIQLSVANVDLISINLLLSICSTEYLESKQ